MFFQSKFSFLYCLISYAYYALASLDISHLPYYGNLSSTECVILEDHCWKTCGSWPAFYFKCSSGRANGYLDENGNQYIFSCEVPPSCNCIINNAKLKPGSSQHLYAGSYNGIDPVLTTCNKYNCPTTFPYVGLSSWCRACSSNCSGSLQACIEGQNTPHIQLCGDNSTACKDQYLCGRLKASSPPPPPPAIRPPPPPPPPPPVQGPTKFPVTQPTYLPTPFPTPAPTAERFCEEQWGHWCCAIDEKDAKLLYTVNYEEKIVTFDFTVPASTGFVEIGFRDVVCPQQPPDACDHGFHFLVWENGVEVPLPYRYNAVESPKLTDAPSVDMGLVESSACCPGATNKTVRFKRSWDAALSFDPEAPLNEVIVIVAWGKDDQAGFVANIASTRHAIATIEWASNVCCNGIACIKSPGPSPSPPAKPTPPVTCTLELPALNYTCSQDCASDFGSIGTEQWCSCCHENCASARGGCHAVGFCGTKAGVPAVCVEDYNYCCEVEPVVSPSAEGPGVDLPVEPIDCASYCTTAAEVNSVVWCMCCKYDCGGVRSICESTHGFCNTTCLSEQAFCEPPETNGTAISTTVPPDAVGDEPTGLSVGEIVGISVGAGVGCLLCIVLLVVVVCFFRRRSRKDEQYEYDYGVPMGGRVDEGDGVEHTPVTFAADERRNSTLPPPITGVALPPPIIGSTDLPDSARSRKSAKRKSAHRGASTMKRKNLMNVVQQAREAQGDTAAENEPALASPPLPWSGNIPNPSAQQHRQQQQQQHHNHNIPKSGSSGGAHRPSRYNTSRAATIQTSSGGSQYEPVPERATPPATYDDLSKVTPLNQNSDDGDSGLPRGTSRGGNAPAARRQGHGHDHGNKLETQSGLTVFLSNITSIGRKSEPKQEGEWSTINVDSDNNGNTAEQAAARPPPPPRSPRSRGAASGAARGRGRAGPWRGGQRGRGAPVGRAPRGRGNVPIGRAPRGRGNRGRGRGRGVIPLGQPGLTPVRDESGRINPPGNTGWKCTTCQTRNLFGTSVCRVCQNSV